MNTHYGNDQNGNSIRVTAYSDPGARKYMEDTFTVAYQKSDNGKGIEYAYFGIFDGHGGDTASIFAKNHLMHYIVDQKKFWSSDDAEVLECIKKGFIDCHYAMWKDLDKWPPTASGLPSTAGTTASVAFLRKGKLYIGHCGDSGIVLGKTNPRGGKWIAEPLTNEHKPESPEELWRIESFGGKVQQKQGIHRVVWNRPKNPHQGPIRRNTRIEEVPFLAVARSLGDLWSYNFKTEKFVVSPEPDVSVVEVGSDFKCLIFASDGLWNVIDTDFSVASVFATEEANNRNAKLGINVWQNPSRILVEKALFNWNTSKLRADNTSVVCVMLDPPNKQNMFKFCTTGEPEGGTIFDYSTSEAYNLETLDEMTPTLTRQDATYDLTNYYQQFLNYETTPTYDYHMPSTSSQPPPILTYQTTSNESAFVKACCKNMHTLANANEELTYHSSYEEHRKVYANMASRPYPPLHYLYRPALPPMQPNLHDTYKPMERYNYLRPTPEELAAMHNEEELDDTDTDFSDDEDMEIEAVISGKFSDAVVSAPADDSIQIFEISSSNDDSGEEKKNDKENTALVRKKKAPVAPAGRFYATRQTDRKMRSGVKTVIGERKSRRKMQKTVKKAVKGSVEAQETKPVVEVNKKTMVEKEKTKTHPPRVLRSAQTDSARSKRSNTSSNSQKRAFDSTESNKHRRIK